MLVVHAGLQSGDDDMTACVATLVFGRGFATHKLQ